MKPMKNTEVKKHSSPKLKALLDAISPEHMERVRKDMMEIACIEDAAKKPGIKK
jgi:hypothetical protein